MDGGLLPSGDPAIITGPYRMNLCSPLLPAVLTVTALCLAACESSFDARLSADPIDNLQRVTLPLEGLAVQTSDGQSRSLRLDDPVDVDLLLFDLDNPYLLIANAELAEGSYRSVQLLVDADGAELQRLDGGLFPIDLAASTPFADVAFSVDEDSSVAIDLALDLRLSLSQRTDDRYRLAPVLRAVPAGDGAEVRGVVGGGLLNDASCALGAAVYLFEGLDVEPDERDGAGVEPVATAAVRNDPFNAVPAYRLGVLAEGPYTLALTCDGELEDGLDVADPEINFIARYNLELLRTEQRVFNLPP